jgi:4'-phosphopantetheinyl transferase
MPLILKKSVNDNCHFMVWEYTESEDFFKNKLNQNNWNIDEFIAISHPKKQLEWLASRFLAKHLAESLGLNYTGLIKDAYNKPFLQDSKHHLSISHTTSHVAAAIHMHQPIGIDLERISDKLHIIKHKFLTDSERKNANDELEKLCIYWSAKESLYKLYGKRGVEFQNELLVAPFELGQTSIKGQINMTDFKQTFDIQCFKLDNSYLTLAL